MEPISSHAEGFEYLGEDECWSLLAQGEVGRLAVAVDGKPDIFPVNYVVDDRQIVVRTTAGLKLAAAVLGSGVAFEVDGLDRDRHRGWSVVVVGRASEIEGVEPRLHAGDLSLRPWSGGDKPRFIRVFPERVTGRRLV
jgi:nitroimidazol reductase NimA-like FMN-containing flavoprotein (pyridoxamine 5'-phosphate oxidase superfamily)